MLLPLDLIQRDVITPFLPRNDMMLQCGQAECGQFGEPASQRRGQRVDIRIDWTHCAACSPNCARLHRQQTGA